MGEGGWWWPASSSAQCRAAHAGERGEQETGTEKGERRKEKGTGGKRKRGDVGGFYGGGREREVEHAGGKNASAGFAVTVASAGLSTRHVAGVEEKKKDGGQIRMSGGERSRDVLGD
jgi:hypothetical protein